MKLNIAKLSEGVNQFSFTSSASELSIEDREVICLSPVTVEIQAEKNSDNLFLTGILTTKVSMNCARCLEPFQTKLETPFELILSKREASTTTKSEVELSEQDLITIEYEQDIIDLQDQIREALLLAIPIKPLCSEECQGICPLCGQNLNEGKCDCQRQVSSPKFSQLRSLSFD